MSLTACMKVTELTCQDGKDCLIMKGAGTAEEAEDLHLTVSDPDQAKVFKSGTCYQLTLAEVAAEVTDENETGTSADSDTDADADSDADADADAEEVSDSDTDTDSDTDSDAESESE